MRRVVVTGMGIRSCLGNDLDTVTDKLKNGESGISYNEEYDVMGMRSHVCAKVDADPANEIPHTLYRFMGPTAGLAYLSLKDAIENSGLSEEQVQHHRTGLIMGSSSSSSYEQGEAQDVIREKGLTKVGPARVFKTMNSTVSANLATAFKIRGMSYTIASACTTSLHCIGEAYQQIAFGTHDVMFAGGAEAEHWTLSCMLDSVRALSTKYNDRPQTASRPYDKNRDGFVIGYGSGALVLEEYHSAMARGATIYGEIVGYSATSDGHDMSSPSGEGAIRCMQNAVQGCQIDYINTHGTSTPAGDIVELDAIRNVFPQYRTPFISSTKSMTGHGLGTAGVHEAIFCLLMMKDEFIAPSINIENIDPKAEDMPIVKETMNRIDHGVRLERVMTNSFGFGGTNACMVFERL